jgi:hypothetical protein
VLHESGGSKEIMPRVVRIERVAPVENAIEEPVLTPKGYKMADPGGGPDKPRPAHAIFHRTLEEVAGGLQRGLSLWMGSGDAGEILVPANKLRAVYAKQTSLG